MKPIRTSKITALACGIVFLGTSALASAQDKGPYIFGNFGWTKIDSGTTAQDTANELVALGFASANVDIKETSTGFKVGGGYRINQTFAAELYYVDLGKFDVSIGTTGPAAALSGDVKATALGIDGLAMMPFAGKHLAFLRVGVYNWDSKASLSGAGVSASASDSGTDFKFGVGADWSVANNVAVRTEWEYYNNDNAVSMLSVGMLYRF